ncbi:hypothetical protein [Vitiosangium sp. GDMCC 1.1324]|uniref:hypothetical protein n=1 Tax=Vitiosangium sp. (strain GDMCC 1.1324) TaxID=2138576 RepID=UPI000D39838B|nr:hypothetical protein [Vitiosangium sp. GDMCC 1.1324]PTL76518.1 hypothetical protein DAT35_48750 [Vitiosangium sp. GDMCC 1.1324]
MSPIRTRLPHRSSTLPTLTASHPKPPTRASTLPPTAASSMTTRPAVSPAAVPSAPIATQSRPVKHPGALADAPSYTPWEKSTGNASNLMVGGGDSKLTPPPNATQNMLIDRPGNPRERDFFGGSVKTNLGSLQASTTHHNAGGLYHYSAQAELNGPQASYELQKVHAGRLGITSGQLSAEANALRASAQAGVSADTKEHAYTAALTAKAETGVGVTASASHDFNRHVGGYVKGEAKASAGAFAEGIASFDPKHGTALLSGQVGASATAGAYGTAGGHLGRLHGSVTAGAVAGVAAQAGGKIGLENGFLKHSADVNAAMGVGTHFKADTAVDLRHHVQPGIASGLRASLAPAAAVGAPAGVVEPEKSRLERFFANMTGQ